jgi:hypothetical protein
MKTIHKYDIGGLLFHGYRTSINVPGGAEVLDIQMQNDSVCMWALVDPEENSVMWDIEVTGTGMELHTAEHKYLATIQQGTYVWHIFRTWT